MVVYTARHLLPVASPAVTDGAVAVQDGRIAAVGRRHEIVKSAGAGAEVRDLGDSVLLPGLVNAHTRLDLSWIQDTPPPLDNYPAWLLDIWKRRGSVDEAAARAATERAIAAMVAGGTVAVGDVANLPCSAPLLAQSPLHGVVFLEIHGFRAEEAEAILDRAAAALDAAEGDPAVRAAKGRITVLLSPHSAHAVSGPLLKALAGRATAAGEILTIQLAQAQDETEMLQDGSGALPGVLREMGCWDEGWHPPAHSPVEYLDRLGVLSTRTLAVHCIHIGSQDISKLQARGVTVVTCPRSNVRLDVGRTPVPKLLSSGVPVALGTHSLATAPDLDLFAEMAALRSEHPGLSPAAVLRMATLNGARALKLERDLGTLEPGKLAALAVVPLASPEDDPFETVTTGAAGAAPLPAPGEGH